jgi:hypothetical protein
MAYYVDAYLVDLEQLHQLYGSHNLTVAHEIEQRFAEDIARASETIDDLNVELHELGESPVPTVLEALHASLAGQSPAERERQPYWFALRLLCQHLGTTLPNEQFFGLQGYGVKFIEEDIEAIANLVFHSPPPGPIAFPKELYLSVGHMTSQQAAERLADRKPGVFSDDEDDRAWERAVCEQFYAWLEAAVDNHKSIVTFFW